MHGYALYYWPLPFRGHFVRYVLAAAGADWKEADAEELVALKSAAVADQPWPLMAPPVLHDPAAELWLSQLPAILLYLGRKFDLLPEAPQAEALTVKVICDAGDVLEEITCDCGARMWTQADWDAFAAGRLRRWMAIFEETGRRSGLDPQAGFLLGTARPMLADLVTAALWHTMTDKLAPLAPLLTREAPATAALSQRIAGLAPVARMRDDWDRRHGHVYCGGQIEESLRAVLGID